MIEKIAGDRGIDWISTGSRASADVASCHENIMGT
jgi:hypothetical protein